MEWENSPYGIIHWYIAKMPHPRIHVYQPIYSYIYSKSSFEELLELIYKYEG